LRKFNSSGTKQWSALHGGAGSDVVYGMAVDSGENAFITGFTSGNLDGVTNSGGNDGFIVKYDASGTLQ
jgi:hypothetical protein